RELPPVGFVRLACLIHAANVRSEPGSNPSRVLAPARASPCGTFPTGGSQGPPGRVRDQPALKNLRSPESARLKGLDRRGLRPRGRRSVRRPLQASHTPALASQVVSPSCQRANRKDTCMLVQVSRPRRDLFSTSAVI